MEEPEASNVIDLMAALRASLAGKQKAESLAKPGSKKALAKPKATAKPKAAAKAKAAGKPAAAAKPKARKAG